MEPRKPEAGLRCPRRGWQLAPTKRASALLMVSSAETHEHFISAQPLEDAFSMAVDDYTLPGAPFLISAEISGPSRRELSDLDF